MGGYLFSLWFLMHSNIDLRPQKPEFVEVVRCNFCFLCWHHLYIHVLVNGPTTGYGIFIENMLDAAA